MPVRLTTKKKISNPLFKLEIGTTNKDKPEVIYIEGKAYVSPKTYKDDYTNDIRSIKYDLKRLLRNEIAGLDIFDSRFIVDIQIADKGVSFKKKSFLNFQFLVRQKIEPLLNLKDIKVLVEPKINNLVSNFIALIYKRSFAVSKTKS